MRLLEPASQLQHALPQHFNLRASFVRGQLLRPVKAISDRCVQAGQRVDGHLTLSATWRSSCSSLTLTCSSRQHMQCQVARQRKSTCCRQSCTQSKRPRSHHDTLVSALEVHGHLHGIAHEALMQAVQLVLVPGAHSENSWSERVSSAAQQLNSPNN